MLYNKRIIHLRAPMRISFVGGGTDFPEYFANKPGEVISTTVDAFMYVTVKDMFDTNVRVHHSMIETEAITSRITHAYTRTALEHFGIFKGAEVVIVSDVMTTGSGLGASSALMSALALGCSHLRNYPVNGSEELARLTLALENQAGTIGGWQDQYATCCGGFNAIAFNGDGVNIQAVSMPTGVREELESRTLMIFTNLARNPQPIQTQLVENPQVQYKHDFLDRMYQYVQEFKRELTSPSADVTKLGQILDQTWQIKKQVNPLSTNLYVDELYKLVRENGVVGGKVTGAGGGGFFLTITESLEAKRTLMYKLFPNYIGMDVKFYDRGTEILWKNF